MNLGEIIEEIHIGVPIHIGMNLYPGIKGHENPVEVRRILKREIDGVEVPLILRTPLNGTYIETGRHIKESGVHPIDILRKRGKKLKIRQEISDEYIAVVAHVRTEPKGEICLKDVEDKLVLVEPGYAFIINTIIEMNGFVGGYTDYWLKETDGLIGVKEYNEASPFFSQDLIEALINKEIVLLGGGNPSFSKVSEGQTHNTDMLELFYTKDENMILAPLVNLDKIKQDKVVLKLCPEYLIGVCPLNVHPVIYQGELGYAHMRRLERLLNS